MVSPPLDSITPSKSKLISITPTFLNPLPLPFWFHYPYNTLGGSWLKLSAGRWNRLSNRRAKVTRIQLEFPLNFGQKTQSQPIVRRTISFFLSRSEHSWVGGFWKLENEEKQNKNQEFQTRNLWSNVIPSPQSAWNRSSFLEGLQVVKLGV
jgi:hypothetical protein